MEFEGFAVQRFVIVGADVREIARVRGRLPEVRAFARRYARTMRPVVIWNLERWLELRPKQPA